MLREAFVAGRLDLAQLCDRAGQAYGAATWRELHELTADLPSEPGGPMYPWTGAGIRPEAWAGDEARHLFAPSLLLGLALVAVVLAAWAPAAVIPLGLLSLSALSAAGWCAIGHR
jgi:hypothetical protein